MSKQQGQDPSARGKIIIASAGVCAQLRAAVRSVCDRDLKFSYCGHACSAVVLLRALGGRQPQIVLMDDDCLNGDRLGVLACLHRRLPAARTLLVGDCLELGAMPRALHAGVWGILTRDRAADELAGALLAVARGELWLSRGLLSTLVMLSAVDEPHADLAELTPRENAVMRGVLSGHSNKQIGRTLEIAEHTVKIHLHHIYVKLHMHRRVDLLVQHGREMGSRSGFSGIDRFTQNAMEMQPAPEEAPDKRATWTQGLRTHH